MPQRAKAVDVNVNVNVNVVAACQSGGRDREEE